MNQFKKLTLFPDKWFEKMTERELNKSRAKLDAYSTSTTLETGLKEVGSFLNLNFETRGSGQS